MARSTTSKDKLDYELAGGDVDKAIKIATEAIEKKFGIKFKLADVRGLKDVGDLLDLVSRMV